VFTVCSIVVNRLWRENGRQSFGQRQAVERAVAADGNQPVDAKLGKTQGNEVELRLVVRVDVVARRADECAALGRIDLRDFLKQGIQMKVRHAGVEEAVEALDESVDFNPKLVGAHDGAVNGGVERRCVAPGSQDADAFHGCWCCSGKRSATRRRWLPARP